MDHRTRWQGQLSSLRSDSAGVAQHDDRAEGSRSSSVEGEVFRIESLGLQETAWTKSDALELPAQLADTGVAVLGGDV